MAFAPRLILSLLLLGPLRAQGPDTVAFRQWIAGQEAGGSRQKTFREPQGERVESQEWTRLARQGTVIEQQLRETALRHPDGSMAFTWTLTLSQEPLEGEATWSPLEPTRLQVTFKNGAPRTLEVPADVVLWPGAEDESLKAAARKGTPLKMRGYSLPAQQWTGLDLAPLGPDPLPGFPDAVRFKGRVSEGTLAAEIELWVSPRHGRLKHITSLGGIPILSQRTELPPPPEAGPDAGLFERTLKTLPRHPFLLWLPAARVRWTGQGVQALPEDPQQRAAGPNRFELAGALAPTGAAAAELPVKGKPGPEDAPFLAATPLVQFQDPVFAGLEQRLRAPAGASRWELAKRITAFVYDWIKEKNYTVGFASAQEVARIPKGDCTEHGVLAVALLRRLGVPARGVTGWVAIGETLGLHFWIEARIGGRWIPLDPTFAQAPASTYRLKLGTTDLADLGSVEWESAATHFLEGSWVPDGPWATDVRVQGDTALVPGGRALRVAGSRWTYGGGRLDLIWEGAHGVEAVPCPAPAQLTAARFLQGARTGRTGWWDPASRQLWMDLGGGQWLGFDALGESLAFRLLDALEARQLAPAKAKAA